NISALPIGMVQCATGGKACVTGVSHEGFCAAAYAINRGTVKVAPYAANRGPNPRTEARARRLPRNASPAATSYANTGMSASDTVGAIQTSHAASARNARHPTKSDQCRPVAFAEASSWMTIFAPTGGVAPALG